MATLQHLLSEMSYWLLAGSDVRVLRACPQLMPLINNMHWTSWIAAARIGFMNACGIPDRTLIGEVVHNGTTMLVAGSTVHRHPSGRAVAIRGLRDAASAATARSSASRSWASQEHQG